ncbi:MAG: hypothetical protein ACSLE8_07550 [Rhodococcus sp. (in: high G+C Gram-positive bacteria)]
MNYLHQRAENDALASRATRFAHFMEERFAVLGADADTLEAFLSPLGDGAAELVEASESGRVFARSDRWWPEAGFRHWNAPAPRAVLFLRPNDRDLDLLTESHVAETGVTVFRCDRGLDLRDMSESFALAGLDLDDWTGTDLVDAEHLEAASRFYAKEAARTLNIDPSTARRGEPRPRERSTAA